MDTNVIPMTPPHPWTRQRIGEWLMWLGSHLIKGNVLVDDNHTESFEPGGVLLVLINDEELMVKYAGRADLYDDAFCAVGDQQTYEQAQAYGCTWVPTAIEARHQRRQWADDRLQHVCQYDAAHRFESLKARNLHERSCRPGAVPVVPETWEAPHLVQEERV